jgi:hypothetical protein
MYSQDGGFDDDSFEAPSTTAPQIHQVSGLLVQSAEHLVPYIA